MPSSSACGSGSSRTGTSVPAPPGSSCCPWQRWACSSPPLAVRLIDRAGPKPCLILGSALLLAGSLALLLVDAVTPIQALLAVPLVLGIPNGFNNLGLQAALYETAPAASMGTAAGLFQTFRFTGAILSTAVIGIVLGQGASGGGLHTLAAVT